MKVAIATVAVGLLVLGGLAWVQMAPGKHSGTMQPQSATESSRAEATPETTQRPMQGSGRMMGNMRGMMGASQIHRREPAILEGSPGRLS